MQTNVTVYAHLGGQKDWTYAYKDVVRNLCNASLVAKHSSLQKLANESSDPMVEKRLEIIENIAEERHIELE
jgi:hypothetical protein